MAISGQLNAAAALSPGKELPLPIIWETEWAPEQVDDDDDDDDDNNNNNNNNCMYLRTYVRGCIQKFPDWPPGPRTANGTALCH
jgi:hypothetical protein